MAKYRIIGECDSTSCLEDDWGVNSSGMRAVRINGTCVERLSSDGKWDGVYNAGKPISRLIWEKNGAVHAIMQDGSVKKSATVLSPTPNKYTPWDYEIEDVKKSRSASKDKEERDDDDEKTGFFGSGWWWKWPFKAIWAIIKFLFVVVLFSAFANHKDK